MLTRALFAFRKIINFVSSYSVSKNIWISSNQIRKNTFFDHLYMRNRSSFRFCLVSLVSNVIASKERKISCKYCAVGKRTPIAFWMRNKFGDTTLHNLSCFFCLPARFRLMLKETTGWFVVKMMYNILSLIVISNSTLYCSS